MQPARSLRVAVWNLVVTWSPNGGSVVSSGPLTGKGAIPARQLRAASDLRLYRWRRLRGEPETEEERAQAVADSIIADGGEELDDPLMPTDDVPAGPTEDEEGWPR